MHFNVHNLPTQITVALLSALWQSVMLIKELENSGSVDKSRSIR